MTSLTPEAAVGVPVHGPGRGRRWLIIGLVVAVVAVGIGGLALLGSIDTSTGTNTNKAVSVDHQATLAEGETPGIASQLTAVPGYRYVDVPAADVKGAMEAEQKEMAGSGLEVRAASFHGVVADDASQNTAHSGAAHETGFLQLFEFDAAVPAGIAPEGFSTNAIASFAVNGTTVSVFEQANQPDSRYMMQWLRHGVLAIFDGADRAPVERWTRAYLALPERQPVENDRLAAALVEVPAYAYTNWWEDSTRELIDSVLRAGAGTPAASSAHAVADTGGAIGGLVLAEVPATTTLETLAPAASTYTGVTAERETIAGATVLRAPLEDGADALYVWVRDGVAGGFVAYDDNKAVDFLNTYLAA